MSLPFLFDLLHFLGGGVCHQLPERSFQVGGLFLPLCARCSGTYLGAVIGLLAILLLQRTRASLLPRWPILALFALFFLAWSLDGLNSYLTLFPGLPHLYEPYNNLRLLTGTLQGLALSLVLWPVAAFTFWRQSKPIRIVSPLELVILLGVALAVVWLVAGGAPVVLYVAGLLSSLGLVSLFVLLNTLLLTVALGREGTFDRFSQVLPLLMAALLLAATELVLLSLLRHLILGF